MKADAAPIDRVLRALGIERTKATQYRTACPAHNDDNPSLAISVESDGTVAIFCHARCTVEEVCEAAGLTMADLFPAKGRGKASKPAMASKPTAKAKPKPITREEWDEARQAAKKLGPKSLAGFKLVAVYPYRDASGKIWGWRARYESKSGEKQIKPFHHDGRAWVLKEPKPPRAGKQLYRLPEVLAAGDPIFIVEGEKCADALADIGIAATTSGASGSAGKADWTPLAGRQCIIWPDDDCPGEKYAADVADALAELSCDVSIVDISALDLPNEGEGDDAADWLTANPDATAADVLDLSTIGATTHDAVNLIRASDVVPKSINWLWEYWLARGMLALLAGDGGTGKTTLALTIAAAVTTGGKLPDGTKASRGSVLIWTGEDAIAEVLVPRLIEAGADLSRVHFVASTGEGEFFDPATDMPALEQQTQRVGDVALVIVDPIVSAIVGDSHKNAEVRRGLQPLMTLAANTGAAVVGITHYAKGTAGRKTNDRVIGSVAFSAVARVVLATVMGADGECRLVRSKSNIGPHGDGFTYSIEVVQREFDGVPASVSKVAWGPALFGGADELLGQLEGKRNPRDEAADWLYAVLQDGPVPSKELKLKAAEDGLAWRTIERAKEALTVVAERKTDTGKGRGNGEWIWRLPNSAREAAQELSKAKYRPAKL